MKRIFFFLLLCSLCTASLLAQTQNPTFQKLYGEAGFGSTSYSGGLGAIGIRTVLSNSWTFGLSYQGIGMDPKNQPADFKPDIAIFFPIYPSVDMDMFSLTAGKLFKAGRRFWFTTDAGLSLVSGNEYQYRRRQSGGSFIDAFTSNYSYTEERQSGIGALLKAEANWGFAHFMGISAGAFTCINSIQSPVGGTLKLLVGKMGTR